MIHNKVVCDRHYSLTDLLCGITSYYFSVDLRFDCIFKLILTGGKNDKTLTTVVVWACYA